MTTDFDLIELETHPLDTGIEQYITIEAVIVQYYSEDRYANGTNPEVYAGEGVGLL